MADIQLIEIKPLVEIKTIEEILSRCGIANKKKKILWPSCYLYQHLEKFYITHFKELFLLTRQNGYNNIGKEDIARRNTIIARLIEWDMIQLIDIHNKEQAMKSLEDNNKMIFVMSKKEKLEWKIEHKIVINPIDILN